MRGAVVAALLVVLGSTGCASDDVARADVRDQGTIAIGAYGFTENLVLAEIYGAVLEDAGYEVEIVPDIASRELMTPGLIQGHLDLVPEYQGTMLRFLTQGVAPASLDADETHDRLVAAFARRGVDVLAYAPGENKNEFAVTSETATEFNLERISDLAPVASELVLGGPPECPERPFCQLGLERIYGLRFGNFVALDSGGPYTMEALKGGEIDVGLVFTTEPSLAQHGLTLLEDDRALQPSENIVPVIRHEVTERIGPETTAALDRVTELLTDAELRSLNERAQSPDSQVSELAARWLEEQGVTS